MRLTRVHTRFFRSFNYDYELRAKENSQPRSWEDVHPAWYPFVRVDLDPEITAIVGANEAGKTQLLDAVEAALTGSPIRRADLCRYSDVYSVMSGSVRSPEFGATIVPDESDDLSFIPDIDQTREFTLYRPGDYPPFVVQNSKRIDLDQPQVANLTSMLPKIHRLKTNLAIPASVSIAELIGETRMPLHDRAARTGLIARLIGLGAEATPEAAGSAVLPSLVVGSGATNEEAERQRRAEFELARQLLVDTARIDPRIFRELRDAIDSGREGEVEALVGGMNDAIRQNLNVQRWWSQDRDFDLMVEAREYELAFTIRDRTAARYSFDERSQGLRFFLSYFVQLTAHRVSNTKPDILLLDEPDAFLSSTGQSDLLRILHDYALPEDGGPRSQVIYVTHSPFLVDKNAPHRIRVLDKGADREGTRVVRDAANNRYEPLRSSLGSYVAETAFIGGQNLFVEGQADQILLAGISSWLVRKNGTTVGALDLNIVTIVASGGADSVPYMVYLARGRDSVKPPCVALLDGDSSGRNAEKVLKKGEARKKRILKDEYIIRLDTWGKESDLTLGNQVKLLEIEDLIPIQVAHHAALNYLARFSDLSTLDVSRFTPPSIESCLIESDGNVWEALKSEYIKNFPDEHIEKAGFAREVVSLLSNSDSVDGLNELASNFTSLLSYLSSVLDTAASEEARDLDEDRLMRAIEIFKADHKNGMRKFEAVKLLKDINSALESTEYGETMSIRIGRISREFELADISNPNVPNFDNFRDTIISLQSHRRLVYQDDTLRDPAAEFIKPTDEENL